MTDTYEHYDASYPPSIYAAPAPTLLKAKASKVKASTPDDPPADEPPPETPPDEPPAED